MNWSFSGLTDYETCPYRRKLKLDGIQPDKHAAAERGVAYHLAIENFLAKRSHIIPEEIHWWRDKLERIREYDVIHIEQKWGFTKDWEPTEWDSAWCRMIADCVMVDTDVVTVIDWKTGKRDGNELKHTQQAQLYSLGASIHYPNVRIQPQFCYLDVPAVWKMPPARGLDQVKAKFTKRATKMLADEEMRPKPGKWTCKYCSYKTACKYDASES